MVNSADFVKSETADVCDEFQLKKRYHKPTIYKCYRHIPPCSFWHKTSHFQGFFQPLGEQAQLQWKLCVQRQNLNSEFLKQAQNLPHQIKGRSQALFWIKQ